MRKIGQLAAAAAAIAMLSACGGGQGSGGNGETRMNPAFLKGTETAWNLTADVYALSESYELLAASVGGSVEVYTIAEQLGEPTWEGQCETFGFTGEKLLCDDVLVDVSTGAKQELPLPQARYVHAAEGVLVVSVGGDLVALDEGLSEVWRKEDVAPVPSGPPGYRAVYASSENGGTYDFSVIDVVTGAELGTIAEIVVGRDGYVRMADGNVVGRAWDGTERFNHPVNPMLVIQPSSEFASRLTVAEIEACFTGDAADPVPGIYSCLVDGSESLLVDRQNESWSHDGVTYPAAFRVQYFADTQHVIALEHQRADSANLTMSLYKLGSADPLWTLNSALTPVLDGNGMLAMSPSGGLSLMVPAP